MAKLLISSIILLIACLYLLYGYIRKQVSKFESEMDEFFEERNKMDLL